MDNIIDSFDLDLQPFLQIINYYSIGNQLFKIESYGKFDAKAYLNSLEHLKVVPSEYEDIVTIKIIESATTTSNLPKEWVNWEAVNQYNGELTGFEEGYYAMINTHDSLFILLDYQKKTIFFWINDFDTLSLSERASPIRLPLSLWFRNTSLFMCHAAGIGFNGTGVLLTGKGGSGKSTSTLSCLQTQLKYAGDDFVLVDSEKNIVYSLYNIAKFNTEQLERFEHLKQYVSNVKHIPHEKGQIYINQDFSNEIINSFIVKSILLPTITGKKDTHIGTCSKIDAVKALIPSSVWILRADNNSIEKMKKFINSIPTYRLYAGTALEQIPVNIIKHLNEN